LLKFIADIFDSEENGQKPGHAGKNRQPVAGCPHRLKRRQPEMVKRGISGTKSKLQKNGGKMKGWNTPPFLAAFYPPACVDSQKKFANPPDIR
jgi:hypothetical protein